MFRSGPSVAGRVASAALVISALLLTVSASPAHAAPGRAYVANYGSDTVSVIDTAINTLVTTIPVGDGPRDIAVTPDGTRVYVANELSDTVSVIDTASNTVVATVAVGDAPRSVTIAPAGWGVWVSSLGGLRVINTTTNRVGAMSPNLPLNDVFSPNASRAYAVTREDTLEIIDVPHLGTLAEVPAGHSPFRVETSPNGSRVYVLAGSQVRSFATATNSVVALGGSEFELTDLAVSPDGARLYLTQLNPGAVLVLDAASLAVVATVPLADFAPRAAALSAGGDRLYVVGYSPTTAQYRMLVLDTATNAVVASVPVGSDPLAVAVTSVVPPPAPAPVIEGATFYTDGTSTRSGAVPGSRVSLFTSSAVPGRAYHLVLSRDGCRTVLAVLNPNPRYANDSGVIGTTAGTVPAGTPAGRYQICFLAPAGTGTTATAPVTLDVNPF